MNAFLSQFSWSCVNEPIFSNTLCHTNSQPAKAVPHFTDGMSSTSVSSSSSSTSTTSYSSTYYIHHAIDELFLFHFKCQMTTGSSEMNGQNRSLSQKAIDQNSTSVADFPALLIRFLSMLLKPLWSVKISVTRMVPKWAY